MDRDQVLEIVKKELRSLLISAPRGVALPLLTKDYKMVIGREMPCRELGFRNVKHFIDSIPDTVQLGSGPAGLTCYAIINAETRQNEQFVAAQFLKKPSIKNPPAVIRKPMNMAGFTKKSQFGPANSRKTGGGGGARYVPTGYPPRGGGGGMSKYGKPLYSKSSVHAPPANLPPRVSARSSVPSFETGSRNKFGISPVRYPSQGTANPGPTHMPRPQSTSSLPSQTRVVTSTAKPSVRYHGPSGQDRVSTRSVSVYPWKKELESCDQVSIVQLNSHKIINKLVCTSGYIVNKAISDSTTLGLCYKRLLFMEYHRPSGLGKGLAVLLVFKQPRNVEGHEFTRSVHDMAEGTRLKVYGMSFVNVNKKKNNKKEAGVDVYFYERVDDSSSNGRSSTPSSHGSPTSACSISPPLQATPTSQMSTGDLRALDTDILTLLKDHPNGVYWKRLGKQYETKFKKTPPPDILAYTQKLPFVRSEELAESFVVLYLDKSKAAPATMATTKSAVSAPTTPVSTSVKFITDKRPPLPGTVELGEAGEVENVEVVFIESVVSFYVQRIGDSSFQAIEKIMSSYLSRNAFSPLTNLCEENLYALRWNEEGSSGDEVWCRVLIRSILREQKKAYVFCPDFGNSLIVKMSDLKDLPRDFYELPFQAVHCCLDGLHGKDFIDEDKALDTFERLALNKVCIAQVMENSGARVSVELIDSESDGQETINSLLLQDLCSPTLPKPGAEKVAVKFTDIDMDGTATVQLLGPGLIRLEHLMNNINQTYKKPRAAHFVSKVEVGMLCCALFFADGKWYRAVVKEIVSSKQILVEFVDYGNEEAVEKTKLRKKLNHCLFNLPYQAVKCTFHGLPPPNCQWTEAALDFAMQYLETDNVYLQVVEKREGSLPSVKLLISDLDEGRDREGELLDLNDTLLSERHLFETGLNSSGGSDAEAVFPTSSDWCSLL